MNTQRIIITVLIIASLLVGAVAMIRSGGTNKETPDEVKAPLFELPSLTGETIRLDDYTDKIRIVNIWATWCPFCAHELNDFAVLEEAYRDDIVVFAINRRESRETITSYLSTGDLSETIMFLLDTEDSYYQKIGGFSMPETLFIDRDGVIIIHKRGPLTLAEMKDHVETILNVEE